MGNQIWLVTHSDALLRGAVEEPNYNVYHMQPPSTAEQEANQLEIISTSDGIERAIVNLVGDLATYSPRSKVVLLEGEESEVDANIVRKLFPEFSESVNLISAGSKRRVGVTHELLDKASGNGKLNARFYSIVDRDFDGPNIVDANRHFKWNVYHIENYLLEPDFIRQAMNSLQLGGSAMSNEQITTSLKDCAAETIDSLIKIRLEAYVNHQLIKCISTGFEPKIEIAQGFREAAERSSSNITKALDSELQLNNISELRDQYCSELNLALDNGQWIGEFRGRDILKLFTGKHKQLLNNIPYESLRNMIINRMSLEGFQPNGMKYIIEAIKG